MLNRIVPLAALLLALGAAPALAQPMLAQPGEDTTAARTMAQNRKVFIGRPPPPQAAAIPATAPPRPAPQRVDVAAETGRPAAR